MSSRLSSGNVRFCCFHPSYGYEDFLEGYRPESVDGHMVFSLRNGIFKRVCEDARDKPDQDFYLVIDEINRRDIPRIFGELLTVMEKAKRERPLALPLSHTSFMVPRDVYIIRTMNTADRSITLLDTALRRRFGFIKLMPDTEVLGDSVVEGIRSRVFLWDRGSPPSISASAIMSARTPLTCPPETGPLEVLELDRQERGHLYAEKGIHS